MTEAEAAELIVELLTLSHTYGEAVMSAAELWIGASSGLIVLAYLAPERLNWGTTSLIVFLYVLFSMFVSTNASFDLQSGISAMEEAERVALQYDIDSLVLQNRSSGTDVSPIWGLSGLIFVGGFFLGTIGYLIYSTGKNQGGT